MPNHRYLTPNCCKLTNSCELFVYNKKRQFPTVGLRQAIYNRLHFSLSPQSLPELQCYS